MRRLIFILLLFIIQLRVITPRDVYKTLSLRLYNTYRFQISFYDKLNVFTGDHEEQGLRLTLKIGRR